MTLLNIVGTVAAAASMASFVPQAWKIIRSRHTRDISVSMYLLTVSAFALWFFFGILLRQWPLIIENGVCFLFSVFILGMTLLPKKKKDKVAKTLTGKAR